MSQTNLPVTTVDALTLFTNKRVDKADRLQHALVQLQRCTSPSANATTEASMTASAPGAVPSSSSAAQTHANGSHWDKRDTTKTTQYFPVHTVELLREDRRRRVAAERELSRQNFIPEFGTPVELTRYPRNSESMNASEGDNCYYGSVEDDTYNYFKENMSRVVEKDDSSSKSNRLNSCDAVEPVTTQTGIATWYSQRKRALIN